MLEIIIYSLLIMSASLIGVFSVWKKAGHLIEKNLHFLVSFSAGVFLIISYQLIIEVIYHGESVSSSVFWVLIGMVGVWFLFKFIPEFHNHEDNHKKEDIQNENPSHQSLKNSKHKIDPRKVIFSDAIHNIGDGILLAAAFTVSSVFGIVAALGILVHELVQEVSEFFVLKSVGYSTKKALKINFMASSTILIGSIGGFLLLDRFEILEIPLLAISGGAFLIVVLQDLIPHSIKNSFSPKHHIKHIVWFLIGVILMFTVNSQLSHSHGEEHTHEDEHPEEIHTDGHDDEDSH